MATELKISDGRTLSEKVAQELERTIKKEMGPGDRLLPEPALAEKFGVSRGTIRNSLKILEDASLISRQKKRGTIVTARAGLKTMSLVFPGSENMLLNADYIAPVFAGMTEEAGKYGIDVVFTCTGVRWGQSSAKDIEKIPWDKSDGVLIYEEFKDEFFKALAEYKDKAVVVDADGTRFGLTSIVFDNREGGRMAARKLIQAGCRKLAFFGEVTDHGVGIDPAYLERFEGFSSEVLKHGISLLGEAVVDLERASGFDETIINRAVDVILKEKIDGVFDITGSASLQVRETLVRRGKPADFETVSIKTVARKRPDVMEKAYVAFDGYEMGAAAVAALRNLLIGEETPGMLKLIAPGFINSISMGK